MIVIGSADVYLLVDTTLNAFNNLMQGDILLNCNTHSVLNRVSVRINQEVLRVDRLDLYSDTFLLLHTNSCCLSNAGNSLSSRDIFFFCLDDQLTDTCTIDLSHQLDVVDRLLDLVLLEVFHQLVLQGFNVKGITVHISDVVFDVKELTLTEDSFHDLSMPCLNCLLCSRGDDTAALALTSLIL